MSEPEHHINYKKIYFTLLFLLVVSVAGPFIGIKWVTLATAFGIAFVKANLVIQNFMHVRMERTFVKWILVTSVVLVLLFFYGVAPDVMRHEGTNWVNVAAQEAVERGIPDGEHAEAEDHAEAAAPESGAAETAPALPADDFDAAAAFATYCAACHGTDGRGDGVAAAALDPKPADFGDPAFWEGRSHEDLARAILEGGAAVGRSATMPPWASVLDEAQGALMVEYLSTFQGGG